MTSAHALIDTYFDNWPSECIQDMYKEHGFKCIDYWHGELTRIFNATIVFTDEFRQIPNLAYYTQKYPGDSVQIRGMDQSDRRDIFNAFTEQLGIFWGIFPFTYNDFTKSVQMIPK